MADAVKPLLNDSRLMTRGLNTLPAQYGLIRTLSQWVQAIGRNRPR